MSSGGCHGLLSLSAWKERRDGTFFAKGPTICRIKNPNILSGRGGAETGPGSGRRLAGRIWARIGTAVRPGHDLSFRPPKWHRGPSWTSLRKHDRIKCHANRIKEHDERFITRTMAALRSGLLNSGLTPYCHCEPLCRRIF